MKYMPGTDASWELQLPASVMQFLCLLHNLRPRDPLWVSPEFLHALAGTVYPVDSSEVCMSSVHEALYSFNISSRTHWCGHVFQSVAEASSTSDDQETFKCCQSRKPVCDFIRIMLMDSLLNVSANTSTYPPLLLLEVNPYAHKHK